MGSKKEHALMGSISLSRVGLALTIVILLVIGVAIVHPLARQSIGAYQVTDVAIYPAAGKTGAIIKGGPSVLSDTGVDAIAWIAGPNGGDRMGEEYRFRHYSRSPTEIILDADSLTAGQYRVFVQIGVQIGDQVGKVLQA